MPKWSILRNVIRLIRFRMSAYRIDFHFWELLLIVVTVGYSLKLMLLYIMEVRVRQGPVLEVCSP